jgi:hypothetical protein
MDYLDYLTDYTYDDLPGAVRQTISREDYTERRQLVLAMDEPEETALPPALAAAFLAATQANKQGKVATMARCRWLVVISWRQYRPPARGTGDPAR